MRIFNSVRRRLVLATCLTALACGAQAQGNVIRVIVGYPAGATSDLLTRVVAEAMSQRLNQPVGGYGTVVSQGAVLPSLSQVVRNRPSPSGQILQAEKTVSLRISGTAASKEPPALLGVSKE